MINLTPVEALQVEINTLKSAIRSLEDGKYPDMDAWHLNRYRRALAALELAKADAELERLNEMENSDIEDNEIQAWADQQLKAELALFAARAKLYEALQQ